MNKKSAQILWFKDVNKFDIAYVGGKGANLGEIYNQKIPIPNGFIVTSKAYFDFLNSTSLKQKILFELAGLDIENLDNLQTASKKIKSAILSASLPENLQEEIKTNYHKLSGEHDKYVAVRSSATAEDLPTASFAGQQESFLNVSGINEVLVKVRQVFASLYNDRAIAYRVHQGFEHADVALSAGIQRMVRSDEGSSGVMFTIDTESGFDQVVFITSAYGCEHG